MSASRTSKPFTSVGCCGFRPDIESIDRLSRSKVGEALQLFISILNSGVSIVTREPRRTYSQDSINDIAALLEQLIYMSRAHEESATKSFQLKVAWAKKKERAAGWN